MVSKQFIRGALFYFLIGGFFTFRIQAIYKKNFHHTSVNTTIHSEEKNNNKKYVSDNIQLDTSVPFSSQLREFVDHVPKIEGAIPHWLCGSFYYNGPGQFELKQNTFKHRFDGFAMAHRFAIKLGNVNYTNKFIQSDYKREAYASGKLPIGFVSNGKPSFFSKISALLADPKKYDNVNMHMWYIGGKLLALTETPDHIHVHAHTLTTCSPYRFSCKDKSHTNTIHPIYDEQTDLWYNVYTQYGHTSAYQICTINPRSMHRQVVAQIKVDYPAYIHSFAMTKNYILLLEQPFIVNPYDLLGSSDPFISHFNWYPERKNCLHVVQKDTGKKVKEFVVPGASFFFFHIINAFEVNDGLSLDVVTYDTIDIVDSSAAIEHVKEKKLPKHEGTLERLTVDLIKNNGMRREKLSKEPIEFPVYNVGYTSKHYTIVYAVDNADMSIKKLNLKDTTVLTWNKPYWYVSEPQFVERPGSQAEDDGVLLFIATDTNSKQSALVVLDAKNFKELAKAWLPTHVPLGYHSTFIQGLI